MAPSIVSTGSFNNLMPQQFREPDTKLHEQQPKKNIYESIEEGLAFYQQHFLRKSTTLHSELLINSLCPVEHETCCTMHPAMGGACLISFVRSSNTTSHLLIRTPDGSQQFRLLNRNIEQPWYKRLLWPLSAADALRSLKRHPLSDSKTKTINVLLLLLLFEGDQHTGLSIGFEDIGQKL